jgi:hypothetical protein
MAIITLAQVAPWVQSTTEELEEDPLAPVLAARVSLLVNEAVWGVGKTEQFWMTPEAVPETAKMIAEQVFARVYQNPKTLVAEGSTGPLGGDRYSEIVLTGLALRPDEVERLHKLRPSGDDGGLWILSLHDTDREKSTDTVQYVDAYGEMTVPGVTYLASDYDHV